MTSEDRKNPTASILITAFNRKEYLMKCVESALNQTFDRKKYEVIVSKNFKDEEIDKFLNDHGCINIYDTVEGIGIRLVGLIKRAKSNILLFLEDDDIFSENKVEEVVKLFENANLSYINNSYLAIDKDGNLVKLRPKRNRTITVIDCDKFSKELVALYKSKEYFGMSNISLRKQCINPYLNVLKDVVVSPDLFFFILLDLISGEFLFLRDELTFYRIHNSLSKIGGDLQQFTKRREFFWSQASKDLRLYKKLFKNQKQQETMYLINMISFEAKIHIFLSSHQQRIYLADVIQSLKFFAKEKSLFYTNLFILVTLAYFCPKIAKKLYYYLLK